MANNVTVKKKKTIKEFQAEIGQLYAVTSAFFPLCMESWVKTFHIKYPRGKGKDFALQNGICK